MDLLQLQTMGAFVRPKIVTREVKFKRPVAKPVKEWADPDEPEFTGEVIDDSITVNIRVGSPADGLEIIGAERRLQPYIAVLRFIVDADGKPLFPSLEKAQSLALWLAMPLFEAISKEGRVGPKASRRRTSGGATSPSPSAAERSANGKPRSTSKNKRPGTPTSQNADP